MAGRDQDGELVEHLRRAVAELARTRRELEAERARAAEPVAVVGMACRLPGADSPAQLWRLLESGGDAVGPMPGDRGWDPDALYDPDPGREGRISTREGGFLRDAAGFDADFFGISPREAAAMDPQQRLLLEVAWEALEDARLEPDSLHGSDTGVYTGIAYDGREAPDFPAGSGLEGYRLTGTAGSVASGRVAYALGLTGPAVSIDTACSSSLVAVHLAVRALRAGECSLALASGVSVVSSPYTFIEFSRQRGLAPDGRCKPFAAAADGTGWAEGVGVLVLERLSLARERGHRILSVICGSAVNQDGASSRLSAPYGPAQERVIRAALADARLAPGDVDAVEAHGTGTTLGDPIEARALMAAYGRTREAGRPLRVGSVKSNLGHTQGAAGVAGLIKMTLALGAQRLPASLHIDAPTPHVEWDGSISLLTQSEPWLRGDRPRRAGVSGFGISGTNAHVILEEAPASVDGSAPAPEAATPIPVSYALSAKTPRSLSEYAHRLAACLADADVPDGWQTADALAARPVFAERAVVVAADREELTRGLDALAASEVAAGLTRGRARAAGRCAVVFSGQGTQRPGMGRELYEAFAVFAASLDEVCGLFDALLPHPLKPLMFAQPETPQAALLATTEYAQPAIFAFEVALYRLLTDGFGLTPSCLAGHSVGEVAAAYAAGALSLADAVALIAARGRLMQAVAARGAMVAIGAPEAEVAAGLTAGVEIAAVNAPDSTVISGDVDAVAAVTALFAESGVKTTALKVSHAFHSAHMDAMLDEFAARLGTLAAQPPRIPLYSALSGERLDTADAEHWVAHARRPVRFREAVEAMARAGATDYVELGAECVLAAAIQRILADLDTDTDPGAAPHRDADPDAIATLRRGAGETASLLGATARLWTLGLCARPAPGAGTPVDQLPDLPAYAFEHTRYWLAPSSTQAGAPGLRRLGHALLSAAADLPDGGLLLFGRIGGPARTWLADHTVAGRILVPGTAFADLALSAGAEAGCPLLEELVLHAPLLWDGVSGPDIEVTVAPPDAAGRRRIEIHARDLDETDDSADSAGSGTWRRHASGVLAAAADPRDEIAPWAAQWPPTAAAAIGREEFYAALAARGFGYGPAFQGLELAWRDGDRIFAGVELPAAGQAGPGAHRVHPALLDAALQPLTWGAAPDQGAPCLPFSLAGVWAAETMPTRLRVCVSLLGPQRVALSAADEQGRVVLRVDRLDTRPAVLEPRPSEPEIRGLYELRWTEADLPRSLDAPDQSMSAPESEVFELPAVDAPHGAGTPEVVARTLDLLLERIQRHITASAGGASRAPLVVLTRGAVAALPGEGVRGLAGAAAWGLVRSAQTEHPDRFLLIDIDDTSGAAAERICGTPIEAEAEAVAVAVVASAALAAGEPQLAVRSGRVLIPALAAPAPALALPDAPDWLLTGAGAGDLDGLALSAAEPPGPLAEEAVRIRTTAAGLNFRDVLTALGVVDDGRPLVGEGAGVVVEVGDAVRGLAPGDRVMGLMRGAGPVRDADPRLLTRVPDGWSDTEAACAPIAYLTAYYALCEVARLGPGRSVLIHAASGGVGVAATRLARHLGAEAYATASPGKWSALAREGYPPERIASSRDLGFERRFRETGPASGFDAVLNCLAGEYIDAGLRLVAPAGFFLEMGKTDLRGEREVAAACPGVTYHAFDLISLGPDAIVTMLAELARLFAEGELGPLPVSAWDVRRAPEALRFMSQARHTGKIALTVPARLDPEGTALVTGGTGTLGALAARRLVERHGVRRLVLASRSGAGAPGAEALRGELTALGAEVSIVCCDVADRAALAALLDTIPAEHPLTAVVHAAGALDDAIVENLTPARLRTALAAKAGAAWHLHELTRDREPAAFVLFSAAAGVLGAGGQAGYAAANCFLDALAAYRRSLGLPAVSLAWGQWSRTSTMTGALGAADLVRLRRLGVEPMDEETALDLMDAALGSGLACAVTARFDAARLAEAVPGEQPKLLRGLAAAARAVRSRRASQHPVPATTGNAFAGPAAGRADVSAIGLLDLVRAHAAAVLGRPDPAAIVPGTPFKELGFDSLTAVELRNRLSSAVGVPLPTTLAFDHPCAQDVADHLLGLLGPAGKPEPPAVPSAARGAADPSHEPIAIVGMGIRLPGGVEDPEGFWDLLMQERDVIGPLPADRGWDPEALYDPDPDKPGSISTRFGGFLDDVAGFDAEFFGISPREALAMDPQQRLLLEVTWEALEHAGIDPLTLRGTDTSVYLGIGSSDYAPAGNAPGGEVEGYRMTGNAGSVASGRVAYVLGLGGGAVSVDTACSSSLVALHVGVGVLRGGGCSRVVVGGVAVMSSAGLLVEFSRARGLSVDGRCGSFGEGASGTGWSEGCGVLVLERLSDAVLAGRRVLAVVRGSAVNQDGASNGLTAPSGVAQVGVLRGALCDAGLGVEGVDVVEGHGTGTVLGDPVEVGALSAVFGGGGLGSGVLLGSVKSVVGHVQAAAGVVGVVKMVLGLGCGVVPGSLGGVGSSRVVWEGVELVSGARVWPDRGRVRRAGVSSFGISGTNAHVILEQAPPETQPSNTAEVGGPDGPVLWPLAAKSPAALTAAAGRLADWLDAHPDEDPRAVAAALAKRSAFAHRAVVDAAHPEDLRALSAGATASAAAWGTVREHRGLAFIFTGQGSQHPGMAAAAYRDHPAFARALDEVCDALDPHLDRPLRELMFAEPGSPEAEAIGLTGYAQPAIFAVGVALARFFATRGLVPDLVAGHSVGEFAAAHVAGVLSLEDAAALVCARGRLMQQCPQGGAMIAIEASQDEARAQLAGHEDQVDLASVNGPTSVVLSGEAQAVERMADHFAALGRRTARLKVSHAFHSPHMNGMLEPFHAVAESLAYRAPAIGFVSGVTGELAAPTQVAAPEYWVRHARETVRFRDALAALDRAGATAYLELGADSVLTPMVGDCLGADAVAIASLRREIPDALSRSLAQAWVEGLPATLVPPGVVPAVGLPTYPWQRERYWLYDDAADRTTLPAAHPQATLATVNDAAPGEQPQPLHAADRTAFVAGIAELDDEGRRRAVLDEVRAQTAAVLGQRDVARISQRTAFKDLGFDSMASVALAKRLSAAFGLSLPAAMVFDHPTPQRVAEHALALLAGAPRPAPTAGRPRRARAQSGEQVAIVGMACRFPGAADLRAYWRLIASGADAIGPIPGDRGWDPEGMYEAGHSGGAAEIVTRWGGFLDDAAGFDAGFFGISPREAVAMDPQQRHLLETAWEALEDAGMDPSTLRGTETGVYAGMLANGYDALLARGEHAGYRLTGSMTSVASGRLSYTLGLEGPAVSIDTACSSSLVAMHTAVQALRAGECSLALAGGVTVLPSGDPFVEFSRQAALAPDGRCKAFSAGADGMALAEGVGVLVLEPLSLARAAGRRVWAVIRGGAVNQDGASNGLTAPNGPSQERVIRAALEAAGLSAQDVDMVEAHGTGTALGDPIEARALIEVYGPGREPERPLRLGSVKSNIGHTQAAAGVAGVIKTVLAMHHGVMPKTLHADEPTPHVDWTSGTVRLLSEPELWNADAESRPRRAAVSAFGISGTNAHMILEQAPDTSSVAQPAAESCPSAEPESGPESPGPVIVWPLSARNDRALGQMAARLRERVGEADATGGPAGADEATARALTTSRTRFAYCGVVIGTGASLRTGLGALAAGEPAPGVITGTAADLGRTVFVFPGQGSQWAGMGRELARWSEPFRAALDECAAVLDPLTGWSLLDMVRGEAAAWSERADVVQPALFAVMIGLARVWESAGVRAEAVVGHSQGEIAAACLAGALSLEDAARVVVLRAQAITRHLPGTGAMVSIAVPADRAAALIDEVRSELPGALGIAVVNGPGATVVSGDTEAAAALEELCRARDIRAARLPVDYASHCALVDVIRDEVLEGLAGIEPRPTAVPLYSGLTGARTEGTALDADYWFRSLREPVRFDAAARSLISDGFGAFVECSPHPVLTGAVRDLLEEAEAAGAAVGSVRRDDGGRARFLESAAQAFVAGVELDWSALLPAGPDRGRAEHFDLPTYPFQHRRYWPDSPEPAADLASCGLDGHAHPVLRSTLTNAQDGGVILTGAFTTRTLPWAADHAVNGAILFPGTAFLDLALQACAQAGGHGLEGPERPMHIEELTLEAPLRFERSDRVRLQVAMDAPDDSGRRRLTIHARLDGAREDGAWHRHASGLAAPFPPELDAGEADELPEPWPPAEAAEIDLDGCYARLRESGYEYGPAFQGLRRAWRLGDEVLAEAELGEEHRRDAGRYGLHPALLDAILHAGLAARPADDAAAGPQLPFVWSGVAVHTTGPGRLRARITPTGPTTTELRLYAEDGTSAGIVTSLTSRPIAAPTPAAARDLYAIGWSPLTLTQPDGSDGDKTERAVIIEVPDHSDQPDSPIPATVHAVLEELVPTLRSALSADEAARIVVTTRGAMAALPGEIPANLPGAAAWGLIGSVQSEYPGRVVLLDTDGTDASRAALPALLRTGESQVALRTGQAYVPRLAAVSPGAEPPADWRLRAQDGRIDGLTLAEHVDETPLPAGHVRVAVRAAGLNFRDVVVALGMVDDGRPLLGEAAGIVVETAPDVAAPAVGDRVMGLFNGVGPLSTTDARLLAPVPAGWSDLQAATTPIVFLTAMYALDDLAHLNRGERVLIHAAAGGVGLAALQVAALRGAEVFATASAPKWPALVARGVPAERIASSRDLGFEEAFAALGGVDVVLNSLAGPAVDASLRLLRPGGRFIEMGKTDIRPADEVVRAHPGLAYQAFDLMQAGPDRLGELLAELGRRIREGSVTPLPAVSWDATQAADAFRHISRAAHIGKVGLSLRRLLDPEGTVLITGGTGTLGALVAADLAARHGVRRLLLASRRGPAAPGADELIERLAALGAETRIEACDAADRAALAALLESIPAEHPLTAVIHTAGALDDATLANLTPDQLHRALTPKVDAAWNLHELTADRDLAAFVLFSSIAGTLGAPGQANYAAANTFLDALARLRRGRGLPAVSLAWAHWEQDTGMTGHLSGIDRARMRRSGTLALPTAAGLDLLAAALRRGEPALVPVQLDLKALRRPGAAEPHPVLRALAGVATARPGAAQPGSRPQRGLERHGANAFASPDPQRRREKLLTLTRAHAAAILGHDDPRSVAPGQAFKELGFDSLTSVELRNRLAAATGLRVPAAAVFDHPTPDRLAAYLAALAAPPAPEAPPLLEQIGRLRSALAGLGAEERGRDRDRVADGLRDLMRMWQDSGGPGQAAQPADLTEASDEDLFSELDEALGGAR